MNRSIRKLLPGIIFLCISTQAYSGINNSVDTLSIGEKINNAFVPLVEKLGEILFFDPFSAIGIYDPIVYDKGGNPVIDDNGEPVKAPLKLIVVWLILTGLILSVYMKFINFRGFKHAIELVRGKYDKPDDKGEVTHFQALTTALSATVGMGNIAGVALAVGIGGPGATLWMIMAGILGMASKFTECTLGVKYRVIDKNNRLSGGAMYYLSRGLKNKGLGWLGKILAFLFAVMVIGGSLGGGNMLQSNQAFAQFTLFFPEFKNGGFYYGLVMAFLVGMVIIGGIKSIARVTKRIVPFMAVLYVLASLIVIFVNIQHIDDAFLAIWKGAFQPDALKGGFIGVLIFGFQRGAFSNEAGVGSASIAHSTARTNYPVREGLVALLEPFVDTVVICTMTALVIIFSGIYQNPGDLKGVQLTSAAYETVLPWFPYVLLVAVTLFAFSTMVSWSYYGLKGFDYLFGYYGEKWLGSRKYTDLIFNLIFLFCVVVGASSGIYAVMDFSDMMVLCMAFPNVIGLMILAPEVKRDLKNYWQMMFGKRY